MQDINSISATGLEQFAIKADPGKSKGALGQSDFLKLMLTQIQHQDPLNPSKSGEFLSQLAQFGTVNGITQLQSSFSVLANTLQSSQALQASTMVGRAVLVPGNVGLLEPGKGLQGAVDLPAASADVKVLVQDATGQLVRQLDLGTQPAGLLHFSWDGFSTDGQAVPGGTYMLSAEAGVDGKAVTQPVLVQGKVESITLGKPGEDASLNLRGLGRVAMKDIREIL